jgi:pimeloyl-ACP methyl ester carboxylesterase
VRRVIALVVVLLLLVLPATARAEIAFRPCGALQCGGVTVPLDHAGAVPGTLAIAVYRAPATGGSADGVVLGLPGGPGDSGRAYFERRLARFAPLRRTHDLVFIDPRGTGESGALDCGDAATCAERLGPARSLYTSRDIADDVDVVRAALGAETLTLYGISYGTWLAQTYARRHPSRVEGLVLDAPVSVSSQDDVFRTKLFAALPRATRAICRAGACRAITRDTYRDIAAVVRTLARRSPSGRRVQVAGPPTTERLDVATTALALSSLDVNPALRAEVPAAMAAARAGDLDPLVRLVEAGTLAPADDPRFTSASANLVTQCEELGMPWARTTPVDERMAEARRRLAAIPASRFAPVGRDLAFLASLAPACERWPARPEDPLLRGPLPAVPTLVISGDADMRTPAGDAEEVARSSPAARLLRIGNAGHGGLVEAPGCAPRRVAAFVRRDDVAPCRAVDLRPRPAFPRTLARVPARAASGPSGRVVAAAVMTATDALNQAAMRVDARRGRTPAVLFGGLRGGRVEGSERTVRLTAAEYVRGLRVSGTASAAGRHDLRVRGPVSGSLRVRGRRVTGTLGGRRIRSTLSPGRAGAAGVRVADLI